MTAWNSTNTSAPSWTKLTGSWASQGKPLTTWTQMSSVASSKVWYDLTSNMPHQSSIKQKESIENVQRCATKLVPGLSELSYPDKLRKLKLPTLAYWRARGDIIQVHKMTCQEGDYDKTLPSILTKESRNELRGQSKKIHIERFNKDMGNMPSNTAS